MNGKNQRIDYSRIFDKQLKNAPLEIKVAFRERLRVYLEDPQNPILRRHPLKGRLKGYWSFNVTGDWRALYSEQEGGEVVVFEALGTHSQLYR